MHGRRRSPFRQRWLDRVQTGLSIAGLGLPIADALNAAISSGRAVHAKVMDKRGHPGYGEKAKQYTKAALINAAAIVPGVGEAIAAGKAAKGVSTASLGVVRLMANVREGGTANATEVGSNGNLVSIDNDNSVRFIFDAEGTGHADSDWDTYSDNRLKKNQEPVPYGLDEILQLTPKIYTRYSGALDNGEVTLTEKAADIRKQIGFIAQEVKEIIPEIVRDVDETEAFYSLNDGKIMAVAVKAIQELSAKITT